jgi:hypothetical protein
MPVRGSPASSTRAGLHRAAILLAASATNSAVSVRGEDPHARLDGAAAADVLQVQRQPARWCRKREGRQQGRPGDEQHQRSRVVPRVAHRAREPGHGEDEAGGDERGARTSILLPGVPAGSGTPARTSTAIGTLTAKM